MRIYREAYNREIESLYKLDHPNIVKILDHGRMPDGRPYIVLERLDKNLDEFLADEPIGGWDSFYENVGQPVLAALEYAFTNDILHRDLKPANIMLHRDGTIRLVDFGVAKLMNLAQGGMTTVDFKTKPYAPKIPAPDKGQIRDVYSFCVLALRCVGNQLLADYDDVYKQLDDFDVPPAIYDIISKGLAHDYRDRPANIVELKQALEEVQRARTESFQDQPKTSRVPFSITRRVSETIQSELHLKSTHSASTEIINDLRGALGVKTRTFDGSTESYVELFGSQFRYYAAVKDSILLIDKVYAGNPSRIDRFRDESWQPENVLFEYQTSTEPAAWQHQQMDWFVSGLHDYEDELKHRQIETFAEERFTKWQTILQAKDDFENNRHPPIKFNQVEVDGSRLILSTLEPQSQQLIDQNWTIQKKGGGQIKGEIGNIYGNKLHFYPNHQQAAGCPSSGILKFDTRASSSAIQKQNKALDDIRFGKAARAELREILIDPSTAKIPKPFTIDHYVQHELDESKKLAVQKAMGADSFVVVEGPPGTGKTRLITELVEQTLIENPNARILLTSQTHVALDNALEKIQDLNSDRRLVRIGRRDNLRIGSEVRRLILDNKVKYWLGEVQKNSNRFLVDFAQRLGVDPSRMKVGIAAKRLAEILHDRDRISSEIEAIDEELWQLETESADLEQGDTSFERSERENVLKEEKEALQGSIAERRKQAKAAREELANAGNEGVELSEENSPSELQDWVDVLLNENENTRKVARLIQLTEEWYLRFSQPRDYYAAILHDTQLVAGTCIGIAGIRGMQAIPFDLCIVDEASRATITELLVPLSRAKKWVLVGDTNQLPPFVEDALEEEDKLTGAGISKEDLQETLLNMLQEQLPSECVTSLTEQHRMIKPIGDMVSDCFYEGRIKSDRRGTPDELALFQDKPIYWYSTSDLKDRNEQRKRNTKSFINLREVELVATILKRLNFTAKHSGKTYSVAVMAGYTAQCHELQKRINKLTNELPQLEIDCNTVDAFQGSEADVAIYSVTRSNDKGSIGFIKDMRRANVALSRAKISLCVVGDSDFVRSIRGNNPLARVLDYISDKPDDCMITRLKP